MHRCTPTRRLTPNCVCVDYDCCAFPTGARRQAARLRVHSPDIVTAVAVRSTPCIMPLQVHSEGLQLALLWAQNAALQEKARAATAQAATLQRLLDSERAATAGVRRLVEEKQVAAASHRSAARRCAAREAAQQVAEADARDARAQLASAKAEVRLVELTSGYSAKRYMPRFCLRARPGNECTCWYIAPPQPVLTAFEQQLYMLAALRWQAASECIVCSIFLQAGRQCVMRTWPFRAYCRLVAVGKKGSRRLEGGAGSPGRCILRMTQ